MKKFFVSLCLSFMTSMVLANTIVLNNETNFPLKRPLGKIAVQWAVSANAVQQFNKSLIEGRKIFSGSLLMLSQKGKIQLSPPSNAQYFRVIVWLSDKHQPDLLTNWVDITPNKTYLLQQNQLVPRILLNGAGC